MIFAGDISLDRAKALAEEHFGDWRAEPAASQQPLPPMPEPSQTHIYLVDRPGVQSQIRVGGCLDLIRKSPGYFNSVVVSGYFGGAFSSRLNETIRVKKGLTYGARGGYQAQRFAGEFGISTFSKTARTAEAVRAILDEVHRLSAEAPTADELDKTKSYTLGSFPLRRETPDRLAADLWLIESEDLPKDHFQRLLAGIAATEAPDCTRLVGETVDPSKLAIVVVGPAGELRKDLESIAPVTVVTPGGKD